MANPPGMKTFNLAVNETDAVHVYCDNDEIWLQLRRNVPTIESLANPSFKAALALKPRDAHKLGLQLLNIAQRYYEERKAKEKALKESKLQKKAAPQIKAA